MLLTMKTALLSTFAVFVVLAGGCASPSTSNSAVSAAAAPKSDFSALQGNWTGRELSSDQQGTASLAIAGQTMDYRGASADDWAKGTFVLDETSSPKRLVITLTAGPDPQEAGKVVNAIYRLEDGKLSISGNSPDNPNFPAAFDAPGCRAFEFHHGQ